MCEALYAANKSFLSLPPELLNAAALTAMMKDRYDSEDAAAEIQARAEMQSREGTPMADGQRTPNRGQRTPARAKASPARGGKPPIAPSIANGIANNANGRVVGRRTPRSNPKKKEKEDDVLEMAGAALVSMSPGPSGKGRKTPKKQQRDSWSDSKGLGPPSEAFGSPTPSPARSKKRSHKELFPADHAEGSGLEDDEDALGALNGLWMLAESASQEPGDRVRKPKRPRPPRAPASPRGKTKRDFQGADPLASPLGQSFRSAREPGGHKPGSSRKTALKATPPVRMSAGLHTPTAYAQTPGAADLTSKALGPVGPRTVGEMNGLTCGAKGNGVAGGTLGGLGGTPLFGSLASSIYRGAPSAARRRWYLAEHFYSSIDRNWFKTDGYRPWLEHIGLDKHATFNKRDWLVIRAALGKPRRLSLPFLRMERTSLELHRVAIRHRWYEQIQEQIRTGPPPSLNDAREKKEKEQAATPGQADVKKEGGSDVASIAALADSEAKSSAEKAAKGDGDIMDDAELKAELAKLVPTDCPKPLCVGDRVVARHPRVLNVHAGTILVGPYKPDMRMCRVQFDRIELGTELVRDFHVAHLPTSVDPAALEDNTTKEDADAAAEAGGQQAHEHALAAAGVDFATAAANAAMAAASAVAAAAAAAAAAVADGDEDAENAIPRIADAPETAAALLAAMTAARVSAMKDDDGSRVQADDTRVLAEVTQTLDRKQTLIAELRAMNNAAETGGETVAIKTEDLSGKILEAEQGAASPALEPFQRQYASTMLKIRDCNQALAGALVRLREQHGKHGDSTQSIWQRFIEREGPYGTPPSTPRNVASTPGAAAAAAAAAAAKTDVLAGLDPAAEIVAASKFSGRRMVKTMRAAKQEEGAAGPEEETGMDPYIGNCMASLLAVKVCQDNQVTPELMKDVIDRCLESLKPKFEENLPLHEQMKEAFAELRAKIYVPSKNAEEGAAAGGEADAPAADV